MRWSSCYKVSVDTRGAAQIHTDMYRYLYMVLELINFN